MRRGRAYLTVGLLTFGAAAWAHGWHQDGGGQQLRTQPVELGKVAWERDYEKGVATARKSGKPILLLFQEVPG
ncbi:MAG: hypothetical protein AAF581_00745 [Planctomycetota bacterium]